MSVRVIRARADEPRPVIGRAAPFAATAFRVSAEEHAARTDAARALDAARLEAAAIVSKARAEASAIREAARAEGRAAGEAEVVARVLHARRLDDERLDRLAPMVAQAAIAVSERVLGERLAIDPGALAAWVRTAIASMRGARRATLRACTASMTRLALAVPELAARGLGALPLTLAIDDALAEGVIDVRTDLGDVRLDLSTQLPRLVEALAPALREAIRGEGG
jgi:flagellar biosynthesis/type III secretory pathway protein FliH